MTDRILTPQQELFLASYTNPKSDTFSNALQSALKAGYSQEYSENITHSMPEWLSENIGSMTLLSKAERALNKTLEEDYEIDEITKEGVTLRKRDPALAKIKQDSAKFIASTVGKKKYSTKGEEGIEKLATAITGMVINKNDTDIQHKE